MAQRVVYRRINSYNTRSNKIKHVRTPGSNIVAHHRQKKAKGVRAPSQSCDCGKRINGIPQLRPTKYKSLRRKDRRVSRAYGGVLCPGCLKQKIIRAFLIQEIKIKKNEKRMKTEVQKKK